MSQTLPVPIVRYLHQLEAAIKQKVGVVPEEVLSDAREFLVKDLASLQQSEPGISDDEVLSHFLQTYGDPESVAADYESAAKPSRRRKGRAPNWRIFCTKCGRSAPAEKVGITRVAARSTHKYVVGWCHDCGWFRWMRLQQDLDQTNLSDQLGMGLTGDQVRRQNNRPWLVLGLIVVAVVGPLLFMTGVGRGFLQGLVHAEQPASNNVNQNNPNAIFKQLPAGWKVNKQSVITGSSLDAISERLGVSMAFLSNNVISDQNQQAVQVNLMRGSSEQESKTLEQKLRSMKQNPRDICRKGDVVCEFVVRTPGEAYLAAEARYRLPVLPAVAKYNVSFDAAPVTRGAPMAWNKFFNLFLQWERGDQVAAIEKQIQAASADFQFGDQLVLKNSGNGKTATHWTLTPEPVAQTTESDDATRYDFKGLPDRAGVPFVHVEATVTSESLATVDGDSDKGSVYLAATPAWPVADPQVEQLAELITKDAATDPQKLDALLAWFRDPQHIRVGGQTGSRYGATQVLSQKFGNCWDYSDLLITLCRASGIPARQILGWLYHSEGHVWAEVMLDGQWQQIDPTTGVGCGSDYIPLMSSSDGKMSLVYLSTVHIELIESSPKE